MVLRTLCNILESIPHISDHVITLRSLEWPFGSYWLARGITGRSDAAARALLKMSLHAFPGAYHAHSRAPKQHSYPGPAWLT